MPDVTKLITLGNLQSYDTLIKEYIGEEDAKSLHKVLFDSTNKQIKFYKNADATVSDTADFTIDIPADLDSTATIASVSNGVVTLKAGLSEVDGIVANNSDSDITLAKVATTGAAEDISIADAGGLITATDVEGALQELASASAGGVASKTVYITETAGGSGDLYSKRYGVYQGATGSVLSPVVAEKLVDIDIPKDMVVESGTVGTVDTPDVPYAGAQVGDKYIDLVIANASSDHIYIPANSLVDIYTAEQSATQIQLAIDANNVISATIVAGSVTATELASDAVTTAKIADSNVTTAKIADDAVTADKVAIAVHTETQTAGADGVSISVSTTDGQVSAVSASIAANTYDAYGTAASAIASLDADLDASGTAQHSGTFVVSGVTEVDGVLTAVDSVEVEAAGAAAAAVAALDSSTSDVTATTGSSLAVLTQVDVTDGLISGATTTTLGSAATHADTDFMASADYTLTTESEIEALFD